MWRTILLFGLAVSSAAGTPANVPVLEDISVTSEVEVEEGETAILNCSVHSVPTADLVWIQDGVILRHVKSNWASLVLQNASRFHLKHFTCQASNQHFPFKFLRGTTLIRIKGTYEAVSKPHLSPRGELPVLHRPFHLDCTVFELPFHFVVDRLSYTWYKNNKVIEGQSKSTLLIPSLFKEDGGIYSCMARYENVLSTSPLSNDYELFVLVPPVVHMEPRSPNNIVTWTAGKNLTLTCKVTEAIPTVPSTGYSWSYLPFRGQLRPLEARESTLTLDPVTEEVRGQYFCQARSDPDFQGELPPGQASVTVDVAYLKDINLTSDPEVNEGDHVVLTCAVKCNPEALLVWSVDGREVRHVTANVDHYVVERAACSDSKTYTCRASNVAVSGLEESASIHLLLHCSQRDENDVILKPNTTTSMQIAEGQNLTLTCLAKLTSTPVQRGGFSWTFSPSHSSARQRLGETGARLSLGPLTRADSGRYTCQARNSAEDSGQSAIDVTVTVSADMNTNVSGDSALAIKIAVPIISIAILVAAGVGGFILWWKRRCFRSKRADSMVDEENHPMQPHNETNETVSAIDIN